MDFANVTPGTLPEGMETRFGIIEATSLTAYLVDGRWIPFRTIHGKPSPVTPLVAFLD